MIRPAGWIITLGWVLALFALFGGLSTPVQGMLVLLALGGTFAGSMVLRSGVRAAASERALLDHLEDQLSLKRYADLAPQLHMLLSQPMLSAENRLRALLVLGTMLLRIGRAEDAIAVFNELIDEEHVGGPGGAMVKMARATALLQAEHLYDADRAINDLRRLIDRGGVNAELQSVDLPTPEGPADPMAVAGLRLLEIYRDVKTGHFNEAVELFDAQLPALRQGLGHRLADALALTAVALHQLNRPDAAAKRFADATALAPLADLLNRYTEVRAIANVYPVTMPPSIA